MWAGDWKLRNDGAIDNRHFFTEGNNQAASNRPLRPGSHVKNCSESLCGPRDFNSGFAVKICYRRPTRRRGLAQNDSAVEHFDQPLTHRIPVSFNGDRLFRGRTA
jgi:hypothetical protein